MSSVTNANTIVRLERAVLSVLQPITGTRSVGTALVRALGADVVLPARSYAVPSPASNTGAAELEYRLLVKTTEAITVTSAGTSVPITSVLGGTDANLASGTVLLWDPPIAGIEPLSVIEDPLVGGTPNPDVDAVEQIVIFEGLGPANTAQSMWQGGLGRYPALVVAWEDSSPVRRAGFGKTTRAHHMRVFVIVDRVDGHNQRRDQGKRILDAVDELLSDRAEVDGEVFSSPPIKGGAQGRIALGQGSYVYFYDFVATHTTTRRDSRTRGPWNKTREQLTTTPTTDHPSDPLDVVDQTHDMDPETP